jgi:hypothetical protein
MDATGTAETRSLDHLPGGELVAAGLADLAEQRQSVAALLVASYAGRLRLLGLPVPPVAVQQPELLLFRQLQQELGDGAHARYNALVQRVFSFTQAYRLCAR